MTTLPFLSERKVMTRFLEQYRELACLWDQSNPLYGHKETREQAYQALQDTLRTIYDDATVEHVRRKIENMRCSYRRERKKVLISKLKNMEEHKPSLWYYDYLTFLDEDEADMISFKLKKPLDSGEVSEMEQNDDSKSEIELLEEDTEIPKSPPRKKQKKSRRIIYFPEQVTLNDEEQLALNGDDNVLNNQDIMNVQAESSVLVNSETEAYGRTIGLQLQELDNIQRVIAEKIISDVIFYGRLKKLTVNATLNLNEDDF